MAKVSLHTEAPDFRLTDSDGEEVNLSDFRFKKNVLLIFNRSFA